jgi:hypothetical protein
MSDLMKSLRRIMVLLVAASVAGCASGDSAGAGGTDGGGQTGGGACGTVQPCGGSIAGAWTVSSACILDGALLGFDATSICATATIVPKKVTSTGGISYAANQTYQSTGTIAIDVTLTIPTACFAAGRTCVALNDVYAQQMQTDPTLTGATCAASGSTSGSTCVCEVSTLQDTGESGTYATSGSTLTTTAMGETAESGGYCVQGNELHEVVLDMTVPMGPMGTAKIGADLVFKRQ